jgi:hypothetical protein
MFLTVFASTNCIDRLLRASAGGSDEELLSGDGHQHESTIYFENSSRRRNAAARDELAERQAAARFRGICNRIQGAEIGPVLADEKSHWLSRSTQEADRPDDFEYQRADPKVSLGALSMARFMDELGTLSRGESQEASIALMRETIPGRLNVAFTRGYVSSQSFVEKFAPDRKLGTLVPDNAKEGLNFKATHKNAEKAHEWMGFEARASIREVLDEACLSSSCRPKSLPRSHGGSGTGMILFAFVKSQLDR